jgi:hypothetical protein
VSRDSGNKKLLTLHLPSTYMTVNLVNLLCRSNAALQPIKIVSINNMYLI